MKQKIFIVGCARSGTTLLLRLFNAFEDVAVIPREVGLLSFVKSGDDLPKNITLAGKRTGSTIFSADISESVINEQLDLIKDHNIQVINIIRDGRDVIESRYTDCSRWMASMKQTEKYYALFGSLLIRYEDLVRDPDQIQDHVARMFSLKPKYQWSDYPNFVGDEFFEATKNHGAQYEPRPIDQIRIGKNLNFYKELCPENRIDEFERALAVFGYI